MNKKYLDLKRAYSLIFLCMIFAVSVLYYGYTALQMSSIVFYPGDESRFLAFAKSMHFYGNLQENFRLAEYDDVLYSLILSVAYFFYTPEHILNIFRIIGVILMCSACFPAYFLAEKMEVGNVWKINGGLFFAVLSVMIPEMTYTAYLLEEVLMYPLMLWMFYYAYAEFSSEKTLCKTNVKLIILLFAIYITKTYGLVFMAAYCMVKFLYGVKKNRKASYSAIFSGGIFLGLVGILKLVLFMINGMQGGYSHYADQAFSIFPFTFQVFVGIIRGFLFYSGYFIFFSGIIPFLVLCSRIRKTDLKDTIWCIFLLASIFFAILEVVVVIHYSENGRDLVLSRFHYRYLFYFFLPLMLIFVKYKYVLKSAIAIGILAFEATVILVFFTPVQSTGQGICDGIMCYLLKYGNRYPGFSDICCVLFLVVLFGIFVLISREQNMKLYHYGLGTIITVTVVSMPLARAVPIQNTEKDYYEDYIKIADYVNESEGNVLCVATDRGIADPILRHGAYTAKDYRILVLDENTSEFTITENNTIVLLMGDYLYGLQGNITPIDIGTQKINLYLADSGLININKNVYNITFYEYGFLENGYDNEGIRHIGKGGISYGPYIELSAGEYTVEITGDNLLQANYFCYCGSENYSLTEVMQTENKVIFRFCLPDDVNNFEMSVRNMSEEEITLNKILISESIL